jgi:ribosomal protein L44E
MSESTGQTFGELITFRLQSANLLKDEGVEALHRVAKIIDSEAARVPQSDRWSKEIQRLELALAEEQERYNRLLAETIVERNRNAERFHSDLVEITKLWEQAARVEPTTDKIVYLTCDECGKNALHYSTRCQYCGAPLLLHTLLPGQAKRQGWL